MAVDAKRMTDSTSDVENITTTLTEKELEAEHVDRSPVAPLASAGGGALERYITLASAINFGFILQSSWEAIAMTFQLSLLNGGPAALFYGSIFSGLGSTMVATCLAEMASIDPTVGAQYRWSAHFAPRFNRFWGLMQGWLTVFAWICALASSFAILANLVVALLIFNYDTYNPKRWHATLLMWAFSLTVLTGNFWFRRILKVLQTIGAICHVVFFLVSMITLLVLARRSTPGFVFATLTHDLSGWNNPTVAWGIGLLTVTYSVAGFDGVLHMSDEVIKVRTRVPKSIIASCAMNSVMQLVYIIVLLFTLGDADKVVNSPTGLPLIEVYWEATGSKNATNLFVVMVAVIIFIGTFNIYASVSRLTWAFSRDKGLPFSDFFSRVHPTLKFPLNALALVGLFQFLIAIIYIGSATAFNAIISMTALALYISYFFPIFFFLLKRLSNEPPKFGPFHLGKLGVPLNIVSLSYIIFIIIWMPFPPFLPATGSNMNYAGPLVGAIILFGLTDWCFTGRKRFKLPVAHAAPQFEF